MNRKNRWIALAVAALLLLQGTACSQRRPAEDTEPTEAVTQTAPESSEAPVETLPETEPDTEPESSESSSEREAQTQPSTSETEPTAAETEPANPAVYTGVSNGTKLNPGDFTLYAFRDGFQVTSYLEPATVNAKLAALVNPNTVTVEQNPDRNALSEGDFLAILPGNEKAIYSIKNGSLFVGDTAYAMNSQDYAAFKALYEDTSFVGQSYAQWLIYMNPSRVTGIRCLTEKTGQMITVTDSSLIATLKEQIRYLPVVAGTGGTSSYVQRNITPKGNTYKVWLDFDNGTGEEEDLFYTLTVEEDKLLVESSDLGYGCSYSISGNAATRLRQMLDGVPADQVENPETGKPVIYLYPEQTTDVSVKLDFKGQLSYTFPAYNGGWSVTARPDGTLTNKPDGSTHYYLFWDGYADKKSWDFSRGFVVKGEDVESFLRDKLPAMGLLPREYNDFITYWVPQMKDNAYNLITFSTTEYEQTAPLTVEPAPDTVLRVHLVYMPLSAPIEIEAQELPPAPERTGFTLVEWGGTRIR